MHLAAGPPVDLDEFRRQEPTVEVLRAATARIVDALTALLEDLRGVQAPAVRFDPRTAGVATTGDPQRTRTHGERHRDSA
jgi:hypothetical protein